MRVVPGIVGLILIVACGVVHGLQTDRWGRSPDVNAAAARLARIPSKIGNWVGRDQEIPADQIAAAGAVGSLAREYVNQDSGEIVSVMILCGRPGPIAVHPPTVCFVGSGWLQTAPVQKHTQPADENTPAVEFWQGDFAREVDGLPFKIRTFWAWSTTGNWQAADSPRREFAGRGYLYKLYVTVRAPRDVEGKSFNPGDEFMRQFLPVLNAALKEDA